MQARNPSARPHEPRLLRTGFPADPSTRASRARFTRPSASSIVCSMATPIRNGRRNAPFPNASARFITPDHTCPELYSQGVRLEDLGIPRKPDSNLIPKPAGMPSAPVETDARKIWRTFAEHYHLFRGTPTRIWLDHAFRTIFGMEERLSAENADRYFDRINAALATPAFRPRAWSNASTSDDRHDRVAARSAGAPP